MQAQLDVFKKQMREKRAEEDDDITKLIKGGNVDLIPDLKDVKSKKNFYDDLAKASGIPVSQTKEQSKDILQELKGLGPQNSTAPSGVQQQQQQPRNDTFRNTRMDKQSPTKSAQSSVLYNLDTQRRSTSLNQQNRDTDGVFALNNKVLSQKYAELEGAVIKMQKQLEMIPILQGRIYQQEKEFVVLKSRIQDLEKRSTQFPFPGPEPPKHADSYQRRSLSSQYNRSSFQHDSPYKFGSDQYTQIIREQRELQKREESQQMQEYMQQIQRSSEASQNGMAQKYNAYDNQYQDMHQRNHYNNETHSLDRNQQITRQEPYQNPPNNHSTTRNQQYNNQSFSYNQQQNNQPSSFSHNYQDRQSPSLSGRTRQRQVLRSSLSRDESPNSAPKLDSPSKQYDRKLLDPQKINQMIAECNIQAQQLSRK